MTDVKIRSATETDRPFIEQCLIDLQAHENAIHPARKTADAEIGRINYDYSVPSALKNGGDVLIAEVDEKPAGIILYKIIDEDYHDYPMDRPEYQRYGYISELHVMDFARGKGVGQALMDAAQQRLRENGSVDIVRLFVMADNDIALKAYERAGFKPYEVTMEKKL